MIPLADVLLAAKWYGVLLLLAIPGWALMIRRSESLADKGYGLGKAVGLIALAAASWALSVTGLVPFKAWVLWLLVIILWIFVFLRRAELWQVFKKHRRSLLITEAVTLILFGIGVYLRARNPQILDIEKFMDSAILSGLLRHSTGPPVDPWYAGSNLNYYYFGHWVVATVAKLSGTINTVAFNLGFATIVSTAGVVLFTIGQTLTKRIKGGLLVLFLALFASNFHPFLAMVRHVPNYFFFSSGRFTDVRINEYPFYSLSLGDLHAHMLALALTSTLILMTILFVRNKEFIKSNAVMMGGLLGLLAATNAFDVLSCSLLVGIVLLAKWYRTPKKPFEALWRPAMLVAAGALVPLLLFTHYFMQPTGGVGIMLFKIPVGHILMQFGGPLLLLFGAALIWTWFEPRSPKPSLQLPKKLDTDVLMISIFTLTAGLLILLPEIGFIKDIYFYTNPPYALANTVFKIWYTGWILLAISAGSVTVRGLNYLAKKNPKVHYVATIGVIIVIAILCVGTWRGLKSDTDINPNTINGVTYLQSTNPDKLAAVIWARKNISGQPVTLEASGDSYSTYDWFSAYTGLPTILGWRSHEWGWRYSATAWPEISQKNEEVKDIYTSASVQELRSRAQAQKIKYIVVGPEEQASYTPNPAIFDEAFGSPVFRSPTISIYRTR